jgi:hypothetical protein
VAKRKIVALCTAILIVAGLSVLGIFIDVIGLVSYARSTHIR